MSISTAAMPTAGQTRLALFTLGTPHASWEALARTWLPRGDAEQAADAALAAWLDTALGKEPAAWPGADARRLEGLAASAPAGGFDARTCWALDALGARAAPSQYLVFVDGPVHALAHWLAGGSPGSAEQALDLWCAGAQRLLRHAHRHPQRVLMIDAQEAAAAPRGLQALLRARYGVDAQAHGTAPAVDAVALGLAAALIGAHPAIRAIADELHASCTPLDGGDAPAGAPRSPSWRDDVVGAFRERRRALAAARDAAARQSAAAQTVLLQLNDARQALDAQHVTGRDRAAQLARTKAREAQLQKDLAAAVKARQDETAQLRKAADAARSGLKTSASQLADAQRRLAAAVAAQRQQQAAATEGLRRQQAAADTTLRQQQAAAAAAQRQHQAAAAMLRQQLLEVQEHLRRQHRRARRLEVVGAGDVGVRAERVRFGSAADRPPHRHLNVEIEGARLPARTLPRLGLRLVEHAGRPGLALLHDADHPAPLAAWQASGDEGRRSYMLLIPADAAGRAALERLGTADWLTVSGLVRLLEHELRGARFAGAAAWRAVAARLRVQLDELPPRLRYDRLLLQAGEGEAATKAIDVVFEGALCGEHALGRMRLRWQPATAALRWQRPAADEGPPPLGSWPLDADYAPLAEFALPIGGALGAAAKRAAWSTLTPRDLVILAGVFDALPGAAAQAAPEVLPDGWSPQRLAAAAGALRADAAAVRRSLRWRRIARRVLGRRG